MKLPRPDRDASAVGYRLACELADVIAEKGGAVDFATFMEQALYRPGLGYYSAGSVKLGASGDFVTAPELTPFFARTLAKQFAPVLQATGGDVLELGPGSGQLALDLLRALEQDQALPRHYYLLEVSADLKSRQQELLNRHLPHLADRMVWLDALPETGFDGVILANEVIDALPVDRFRWRGDGFDLGQVRVTDGGFVPDWQSTDKLPEALQALAKNLQWQPGFESEYCSLLAPWMQSLAGLLSRGLLLFIDYGFPEREFYAATRNTGTLMCHYRHHSHGDALILPGLQDITAHVNFTELARIGSDTGLHLAGYTDQASFLCNCGLLDLVTEESASGTLSPLEASVQIKPLLMPGEMGELFKVMALTRDLDLPLAGFADNNKSETL